MSSYRLLFLAACTLLLSRVSAQTVPTLSRALPTGGSLVTLGTTTSLDLRNYFGVPAIAGTVVQFDTVLGKFNVEMLSSAAPQNAANFLNYVQSGAYTNTFFHRSAAFSGTTKAIVQGGGFTWMGTSYADVHAFNPVPLEYNVANSRGTLAAARTSDINSATSQWYFNVADNSTTLGPANGGGYTVFGRVLGTGMTIVDAFAALPTYNAGGAFAELPLRNYTSGQPATANFALINSVSVIPIYPTGTGASLMTFSGTNSATAAVNAQISGSNLLLTPLASGAANITITATDTNGNTVSSTMSVTVAQPLSRSVAVGEAATFLATAGANAYQWERNGTPLAATTVGINLTNTQPSSAGLIAARMATGSGNVLSRYAILGVNTTTKLVGPGTEFPDIFHGGTGFTYDQILLEGAAASVKADSDQNQILRMSYIDPSDDIVQVEFSGPGTLTLVLDDSSGPALPVNYNQNVNYMKGRASIILTGASADTHLSVFSVGRVNAVNQGLFRDTVNYDGRADISFIAITTTDGRFGGLRAANTRFSATRGLTGVYAPDVVFTGPVFVGDIDASSEANPFLAIGAGSDVRITGGDLLQTNGRAVNVSGIAQLKFVDGGSSHGTPYPAQANRAQLIENGVDVTSQIVVNP